jgi:hypothetical protein
MTQNRTRCTSCYIAFRDVQVGTADCSFRELDYGVCGLSDSWFGALFNDDAVEGVVDEGVHCGICCLSDWGAEDVTIGEDANGAEGLHCKSILPLNESWRSGRRGKILLQMRKCMKDRCSVI